MHLIPDSEIIRYSRAPSASTISAVSKFQDDIRAGLGDEYETFLQGSYKNDTSIRDLNDVDIVAIKKSIGSGTFSKEAFATYISWNDIFSSAASKLGTLKKFAGKLTWGDKCIVVESELKADVVPAVRIATPDTDPIAIYSFREGKERLNYPRLHYQRGVEKNKTTGSYKSVVRMFKRWATGHWPNVTCSFFFIECLIHSVPDNQFQSDLVYSFFAVARYIEVNVTPAVFPVILSVAGDKDILTPEEWKREQYTAFHAKLSECTGYLAHAITATTLIQRSQILALGI